MKTIPLKINEKEYPVKFGFGANRILGEMWKINTYSGVIKKVSETFAKMPKDKEPPMKVLKAIGDLVLSGVLNYTHDAEVDSDDVVESLLNNTEVMVKIVELYIGQMPKAVIQPQESKNVKGVKK